ncbi:glycoside hydrolase family 13 protein [Granulicoccus phenolivorans]|uniref:glycoside hydrolase family 13 protein n=1 Tax=Granulicoccus phenolivorans TaxID=266854 RepID=UPI0004179D36|nr:alpha-amylase family glycosyl hydrolase [Granulicoccus phenolivorans]
MSAYASNSLDWWRSAVVYQIYPRSFADGNGDGIGDLRGIIDHLAHIAGLGADAIWISPWYPSPQADGGYDVADYRAINPDYGTLAEADELVAAAHRRGLRVLIDLVPNHSSDEHRWFRDALAAAPGSPERSRYIFRDGRGEHGELPPNNWQGQFGGPAWTRVPDGQWYLHLFDVRQPDWNWENPEVAAEFDDVLRFWFDRGIDGFRVDVADSMAKDQTLPDLPTDRAGAVRMDKYVGHPSWDRPELERIHRRWRAIADEYTDSPQGPRVFVSEAYLTPAARLARYVEPGRLHTTFNFDYLLAEWSAQSLRHVIDQARAAHAGLGAPCTWVLGNHDQERIATRLGRSRTGRRFTADGVATEEIGVHDDWFKQFPLDPELGQRRARAAALLELALPGGAYVYQGEELGLPEVLDLPEDALRDPTWERSGHRMRGRDGCRVPIPWTAEPGYGWGQPTWLPQPADWAGFSVEEQDGDISGFLELYRAALSYRRGLAALGDGDLTWLDAGENVLAFTREPGFTCIVNFGEQPVRLPAGEVLLASAHLRGGTLGPDEAAWIER